MIMEQNIKEFLWFLLVSHWHMILKNILNNNNLIYIWIKRLKFINQKGLYYKLSQY